MYLQIECKLNVTYAFEFLDSLNIYIIRSIDKISFRNFFIEKIMFTFD